MKAKIDTYTEHFKKSLQNNIIAFEGVDACGKSTICYELDNQYNKNVILTGNKEKYADYQDILDKNGIDLIVSDLNINEIQSIDSIDVVKEKARCAYQFMSLNSIFIGEGLMAHRNMIANNHILIFK